MKTLIINDKLVMVSPCDGIQRASKFALTICDRYSEDKTRQFVERDDIGNWAIRSDNNLTKIIIKELESLYPFQPHTERYRVPKIFTNFLLLD